MSSSGNLLLLKINEQISDNLSSPQIIKTLDELLFNCLRPMMLNTNYIEYTIVELLPPIFLNRRRKFSNKPFDELKDNLFSVIMIEDREEKLKLLYKQNLERSVFFAALMSFEKVAINYLEEISNQLAQVTQKLPYDNTILENMKKNYFVEGEFYETCQSVVFWLNKAFKFKAMIVEKYIRHAFVQSKKMAAATNLQIDSEDLFRDLILSIHRAIDKYDPKEGTLTSYINIWFREAQTNYRNAHEYGVAYNMPTGKRKKLIEEGNAQSITMELNEVIAESVNDETKDILANLINDEDHILTNNLACRADKHKIYCLLNNIQYTPTEVDVEIQRRNFVGV